MDINYLIFKSYDINQNHIRSVWDLQALELLAPTPENESFVWVPGRRNLSASPRGERQCRGRLSCLAFAAWKRACSKNLKDIKLQLPALSLHLSPTCILGAFFYSTGLWDAWYTFWIANIHGMEVSQKPSWYLSVYSGHPGKGRKGQSIRKFTACRFVVAVWHKSA